jgi:hypothetical protein
LLFPSHHVTSHHITSHHITATANTTINNQQYTIHKQTRSTNEKMGRAKPKPKPKPKAKPKAASPVVIPPAATRKRAQVPDEHNTDKCKALKGDLDEEHGPETDVLKGALEEDKPDEVVDKEVVEEGDGAAEAVKEAEGLAAMDDSEYHHQIGILAATYTLVFTKNYCISTFYFCGTRLFVEHDYLWNAIICGTRLSLWNAFICGM